MTIDSRNKHYLCSGWSCGGVLSQVHPGFNLFRCIKCKGLQRVDLSDKLVATVEGVND